MTGVEKLTVSVSLAGLEVEFGELVSSEGKIYFKYFPSFIDTGIQLSPFKMQLSEKVLTADIAPFDRLFGVFDDSLPDGWGRLLLDRALLTRGISLSELTPLDRLAYIGSAGMGALIYRPEIGGKHVHDEQLELDVLAKEMLHVLEGASSDVIEELLDLGGSSGGARPKIFAVYNSATDHLIQGAKELPKGYEHWMIKFPSSFDPRDMAEIEYAYYKMALDAGIEMYPCQLFKGRSGRLYFGTKRFDRVDGQRIHMHSAAGLMHDNFRLSTMDYGHLMDCAFQLEKHVGAYEKILRLAAFNVFSHNRDDHSKNFSFLMDHTGGWKLAPAYDLTFSSSSQGLHSTTVAGESRTPGRKHLLELATEFGVNKPSEIIDRVQDVITQWKTYADACGVSRESSERIERMIG
jgi:serine/threonine-protein kinase HipA